jgi:hypothetical protein
VFYYAELRMAEYYLPSGTPQLIRPTNQADRVRGAYHCGRAARGQERGEVFQEGLVLAIGEPALAADNPAIRSRFRFRLFPDGGDEDQRFSGRRSASGFC